MNEFGEIAIDAKILQGKNVQMADLEVVASVARYWVNFSRSGRNY